jgi:hypothetical protein
MINMTRDQMIDHLVGSICLVKFIKKNGDVRVMECTLNSQHIPKDKLPVGGEVKSNSPNTIPVFDIQANGWRSFIVDNVELFGFDLKKNV